MASSRIGSSGRRGGGSRWRGAVVALPVALALASCGGTQGGTEATAGATLSAAAECANPNGPKVLEPGERAVSVFAPVEAVEAWRRCRGRGGGSGSNTNLYFHGGTADGLAIPVGVETAPAVYLVFWGAQWSNDPSGEATILRSFFNGVGGGSWAAVNTQYCEGVAAGTYFCSGSGVAAGNTSPALAGVWFDSGSAAPSAPRQSQLAAEAVRAATHFGLTTAASTATAQFVIATATGNNSNGFGHSFCAWHGATSSSYGDIAYTNLPYITDAGASCGADFNGLGANAGITIVEGHEFAETVTDPFPSGGWLDSGSSEIGDKCAWIPTGTQGAAADVTLATGSFPVQSLWSNAFSGGLGGCVLAYP